MRLISICLLAATAGISNTANAADENPCAAGHICASKPETVVSGLQEAGFRAKLEKDKTGDPMISSEASGYEFEIYFYGCHKGQNCAELQFQTTFIAEAENTPDYANAWNTSKRFVQASVDQQKLQLAYDISTVGGVNQINFTDTTQWWAAMLGEFAVFVKEQKALAKK